MKARWCSLHTCTILNSQMMWSQTLDASRQEHLRLVDLREICRRLTVHLSRDDRVVVSRRWINSSCSTNVNHCSDDAQSNRARARQPLPVQHGNNGETQYRPWQCYSQIQATWKSLRRRFALRGRAMGTFDSLFCKEISLSVRDSGKSRIVGLPLYVRAKVAARSDVCPPKHHLPSFLDANVILQSIYLCFVAPTHGSARDSFARASRVRCLQA